MQKPSPRFGLSASLLILATVFALAASACTSDGDQSVTIYSGRNEELIQPILDDFSEETGITVNARFGDSAELALLISEEGDKSPADVFLSQSPGATEFLDGEGRLVELPDSVLSLVPSTVRDDAGNWVGFSGRQRVLVYNPDMVAAGELPSSVFDLTSPEWADRVAIAPANGSFQDFVSGMRAQAGDADTSAWLDGLGANNAQSYPKNSAIVAAVGRGEIAAGLVNHYYNFRAVAEDPNHPALNHQFDANDPGSFLIVTAAAILDSADNSDEAQELVAYLLSEGAQRFFADETFEYPLTDGLEPSANIPAADFSGVGGLDYSALGTDLEGTRKLIVAAGFDG